MASSTNYEFWILAGSVAIAGVIGFCIWKTGLRKTAIVGGLLCAVFMFLVCAQTPWNPVGTQHVVKSIDVNGTPAHIIQAHQGMGIYSTYLVAREKDGKWQWFCIGNDDLRWRTVTLNTNKDGRLSVQKYGSELGIFDAETCRMNCHGGNQPPSMHTFEEPAGLSLTLTPR